MSCRMYSDGVVPSTSASFLNCRAVDSVTCETSWSEHLFISSRLPGCVGFQLAFGERLNLPLAAIWYAGGLPLRDCARANVQLLSQASRVYLEVL